MKDWHSIADFFARYLGIDLPVGNPVDISMILADWIIRREPELAPYVLQVILEG